MCYQHRFSFLIILITLIIAGCGPSEEEQMQEEQARRDSLEQARQDSLQQIQQQRQDSLQQARMDSSRQQQSNQAAFNFTENGQFSVQVASWRSRWKANEQVEMWKERGYEQAYLVEHGQQASGNVWYRVRVGRVDTRSEAQQIQETLRQEYNTESWIASAN